MKINTNNVSPGTIGVVFFLAGLGSYLVSKEIQKKKPSVAQQVGVSAVIAGVGVFALGKIGIRVNKETAYLGALAGSLFGVNYQKSKNLERSIGATALTTFSAYALLRGIKPIAQRTLSYLADSKLLETHILKEALSEMEDFFGPKIKKQVTKDSISTGIAVGLTGLAIPHISKLSNSVAGVPENRRRPRQPEVSLRFTGEHNQEVRTTNSGSLGF